MRTRWLIQIIAVVALLAPFLSLVSVGHAEPSDFNDVGFQNVWERTDKPIEMGITSRSYMWGPQTIPGSPIEEQYADSPAGTRTVQYFDKARMEVNNPNGSRWDPYFVTNGLLVREMVSGEMQMGNNVFRLFPQSQEAVAGDPAAANPDCPTYATFRNIASLDNDHPSDDRTGETVVDSIDKAGNVFNIASPDPSVKYTSFDQNLHHNVPNVFVDFFNQTGPVYVNYQVTTDQVIDGVYTAGLPMTEAYWVKAKVGGVEKDVLVQLFERRLLTYTPSNPDGFKVEMGNVGQHYFRWRYGGSPMPEQRIVFQSNRTGTHQIFSMKTDGTGLKKLTSEGNNDSPRWSPDNQHIAFTSDRAGNRDLYVMNADGSDQKRIINTPWATESDPDWSVDGKELFYSRDGEIWRMHADGTDPQGLTDTPGYKNVMPRASTDGLKIAFGSDRNGEMDVYSMNIDGSHLARLTNFFGPNQRPTDWKREQILLESEGSGGSTIWLMHDDGGHPTELTEQDDRGAVFSPDLKQIAFVRKQVGTTSNIFVTHADGSKEHDITNTAGCTNDGPDWSN